LFTTGTAPLSASHYLGIYGDSSTESTVTQILAASGHFTSFYCYSSTTQNGQSMVFTVRHNFASTTLTCTIPANATEGSTTGASIAFSAGDTIDILEPGSPIAGGGHGAFAVGVGP
jgi:hypothetical protein